MENQICQNLEKLALSLPPDNKHFRTMRLIPLSADLLSKTNATDSNLLRPNRIGKPYPDVETYLETHIRLLWADFIQPLRETIGLFCQGTAQVPWTDKRNNQPMHFYRNVTFVKDSFLGSPTVPDRPDSWRQYYIQFDTKPGFDWQKSKRLIYGSLVCLWNASRRLIILATVTKSDTEELEKGWLTLSIENPPKDNDFTDKTYTMLECEIFYEPYRVVMEAYQQLKEDTFPLKELLLGWKMEPGIPTYLRDESIINNYRIQTSAGTIVKIKDVLNINTWPSAIELGVNPIQRIALHAAMTRQVALIQGPPGTGKTFLGRKIISTLLENKHLWHDDGNFEKDNARLVSKFKLKKMDDFWAKNGNLWRDKRCPIVVICLTNQALDQFLEGVLKSTTKIIRVGSQSQSALLGSYTMTVIKENISQQSESYKESAFLYHQYGMNGLKKCIKDTVDDMKCLAKILANRRNNNTRDLGAESRVERGILLLAEIYRGQIKDYNQLKAKSEEAICRSVDIVGLTTTGAARRRDLLALLQPKIVLVEEAAQVLEPHIIASLTIGCQHVIMIGDHLQLRPQCNVHKMTQKYQMDVSLFERLVKNGVPSVMLAVQHRMRPEVSRLIVPSIYSQLENHPSVRLHPAVPSVSRNVFFLDHNHPEAREENASSYYNSHEAAMALRLAHFLCEQGIEQEKITVLVTYAAQMRTMLAHRREQFKSRSVDRVHITTVDNYQGEENDIIILSLVRNNEIKSAGFLRTPNRVCVALSRARHGLFILGNIQLLAGSNSKLWVHVQKVLTKNGELGNAITLRCDRHQENVVKVSKPEDFPVCGIVCSKKCGTKLECGHPCGMPCRNRCNHVTALCDHKIPINLPCRHSVQVVCSKSKTQDEKLPECESTKCLKKLLCGHRCPLKCSQPCTEAQCKVQIDLSTCCQCGKVVKGFCHLLSKVSPPVVKLCQRMVPINLPCGHSVRIVCYKSQTEDVKLYKCKSKICLKKLSCGHPCPLKCSQQCTEAQCNVEIDLNTCNHGGKVVKGSCRLRFQVDPPVVAAYQELVPVSLSCGHSIQVLCSKSKPEDVKLYQCTSVKCLKKLPCGHPCPLKCNQPCTEARCNVEIFLNTCCLCGKVAKGSCHLQLQANSPVVGFCQLEPMNLSCGHSIFVFCSKSKEEDNECTSAKCLKKLPCGHPCPLKCRQPCAEAQCNVQIDLNTCNQCGKVVKGSCHLRFQDAPSVVALCQELVPVSLSCGHSIQVLCSKSKPEDVKLYQCTSVICLKKLPCGHPCPLKCIQPCIEAKCDVQVNLICDSSHFVHEMIGSCHLRHQKCENPCRSILRCRHRCTGQCGRCSSGVHSPCLESCQRKLLCGHLCPVKCGEVCPPCRKPCQKRCHHRSCTHLCGEDCPPCQEPCEWKCKHRKCNHPCSELCNRKPCSLPCPRRLSCGHSCSGYCGEICPPQSACPVCLNKKLKNQRFIYFCDCGHNVSSTEMVERKSDNGKINIPSCPRCSQTIHLAYGRYADQVKNYYEDLRFARFLYDQDGRRLQQEIIKLLDAENSAKEILSTAVESMVKDGYFEEKWRIYQRMYYVCLRADFKKHLYDIHPFTMVDCTPGNVSLMETLAEDLLIRHQSIQNSLLETIGGFLSVDCLADALAQWQRLDLLRQCHAMETVQPMKSTMCHSFLKEAKVLLEKETKHWTTDRENVVLGLLQFVANSIKFDFIHPDSPIMPSFFQPVSMNANNWIKCANCKSVFPSNCFNSCPRFDCS